MISLPPHILEALGRYDSPTVCNVIELCHHRPRSAGYLNSRIRAIYPDLPPMVGYAVTATFRSSTPAGPDERPMNLVAQVESWQEVAAPRIMVIQDLDDPPKGAVYGEIVATVCKAFGCVGLVTNGYARDIQQVAGLKFPCFAAGVCVSHAYCRILSVGEPVTIGGVRIRPGDLLHGDANGVTTIPLEVAEKVAAACPPFVEAENVLIQAATTSPGSIEGLRSAVAEFGRRVDELARGLGGREADRKVGA